ncbi:MAG: thiamine phosphate synthase [Jannaschia sp.]
MMGPVYVITEADAPLHVAEQVRAAARGGASLIQIRDKTSSDADLTALVAHLMPEVEALGARLIVNDRVEVAMAAHAHGLHIGQSDGDPAAIRRRLPSGMLLGVSVETVDQARIVPAGVSYVGAGPLRRTATKPDHASPIGLAGLAQIVSATKLPAYAIGGIKPGDAAALKAAGAAGLAVVSAVTRAANPEAATRALLREWCAS